MFIELNRDYAIDMAKIIERFAPSEIQINTPLRPCSVSPLSPEGIAIIEQKFSKFKNVFNVYKASKPEVMPFNLEETLRRRPKL